MLLQNEVNSTVQQLVKRFPQISAVIQFGSSISGDSHELFSDVDLALLTKRKQDSDHIQSFLHKNHSCFDLQTHVYAKRSFLKGLRDGDPLPLSILSTGVALHGRKDVMRLKNQNFAPDTLTARNCMRNAFAALGLAVSDLTHSMEWDAVNSMYHAARSAIWAVLFSKEITPNNARILVLLKNKKVASLYKRMIHFRNNPPTASRDFYLPKKVYLGGNINQYTRALEDATTIVKIGHKKIFGKNFIGLCEMLEIIKNKYIEIPDFYSVYLSFNRGKNIPQYSVVLSFHGERRVLLDVDATNGKIREIPLT